MRLGRNSKALLLIALSTSVLVSAARQGVTESLQTAFTLGSPGVALKKPDTMLIAARLYNTSDRAVFNVKIHSFKLDPFIIAWPKKFPVEVGDIAGQHNAVVQVNFKINHWIRGKKYVLIARGRYLSTNTQDQDHGRDGPLNRRTKLGRGFTASVAIVLPDPAPGSASIHIGAVAPDRVSGAPFPPQQPSFNQQTNGSRWTVPTAPD
jgi:hypothetical protein